jgi:hypothetical protein
MTRDQLHLAEDVFNQLKAYRELDNHDAFYTTIDLTTPCPEWIVELPSKSNPSEKYKTLKLETMETLMKHIFGYAAIGTIAPPVITQDRNGRYAVTVNVLYAYMGLKNRIEYLPGIATVTCNDISLLEMATPKASSMAVKNAIKQLGGLFGKYLNITDVVEEELPLEERKPSHQEQLEALTSGLLTAKNAQDLKSYRHIVYSKTATLEHQNLYETRLREFSKQSA